MNNKTRKQKNSSASFSIFKPLFAMLLIGFLCFVGGQKTSAWIKSSPYFQVRRVTCSAPSRAKALEKFLYLKNQNIFDVDLKGLQRKLELTFPEIGEIRVFKRFPGEIYIFLRERSAYAALSLGQSRYLIDRQGFIVSKDDSSQGTFPLIAGLTASAKNIALGHRVASNDLQLALLILDTFNAHTGLSRFTIAKLNIANLSRISFYLGEQLEVVIDQEDIKGKISTLAVILEKARLDWERIRYIDLRFQEPVIKYDQ